MRPNTTLSKDLKNRRFLCTKLEHNPTSLFGLASKLTKQSIEQKVSRNGHEFI